MMKVLSNQPTRCGCHPLEWACELSGTALLLLGGLSALYLDFGPDTPLRGVGTSPRLLLTGLLIARVGEPDRDQPRWADAAERT